VSGSGDQLPVKLYYRIGEVAHIVGVEPHVLRYWETEFRSIRPQKSKKGQRVYSRKDVDRLLRVKELLYAQGFTIAGARKRLREAGDEPRDTGDRSERAATSLRGTLVEVRSEVASMLALLDRDSGQDRSE
jgi:DNA-binding transcriptional MerR regulator